MKIVKLSLGIFSFVLSILIVFQSCAAGLANALEENGEVGGSAGLLLALLLIISGILVIVGRNENAKCVIVAGSLNILGGLIGFLLADSYSDLNFWSGLVIVFGLVYIIPTVRARKKEKKLLNSPVEEKQEVL